MLTDKTGEKMTERGMKFTLCPSQMSQLFCFCGVAITMFVVWHNVFCVFFEREDCHNKKGYQPLKDMGKTKDIAASC